MPCQSCQLLLLLLRLLLQMLLLPSVVVQKAAQHRHLENFLAAQPQWST
jgi:hypothetical protein